MPIYKDFNVEDAASLESSDIVENIKDTVSSGMWENGSGTLTAFYTSSTQSSSNAAYYLDVYGTNPQSDSTAKPQFSVAYGHYNGSGSAGAVAKNSATGSFISTYGVESGKCRFVIHAAGGTGLQWAGGIADNAEISCSYRVIK